MLSQELQINDNQQFKTNITLFPIRQSVIGKLKTTIK